MSDGTRRASVVPVYDGLDRLRLRKKCVVTVTTGFWVPGWEVRRIFNVPYRYTTRLTNRSTIR